MVKYQTKIINLFGAPGSGKSTLAADFFVHKKRQGTEIELVTERAKDFAWERKEITKLDQVELLAEQFRRESRLIGKVKYIVTDSPSILSVFYGGDRLFPIYRELREQFHSSYTERNLFIEMEGDYQAAGRYQTAEQALQIQDQLRVFLRTNNIFFSNLSSRTVQAIEDCL